MSAFKPGPSGIIPGPPYFFVCKKCGHRFSKSHRIGPPCPECGWLIVVEDGIVRK